MHRIRSMALSAVLLVGAAGMAAAQAPQVGGSTAGRQSQAGRRGAGAHRGHGKGGGRAGLRGINLTDAQKTQVKTISEKYKPQLKKLREQARPSMEAARVARQKGDTAEARRQFEQSRAIMQKGAPLRRQAAGEVRGVLTADQQVAFDANIAKMKERRQANGGDGPGRARGAKNGKHGKGRRQNA